MAEIIFYQKPGCRTNARQKQMLEAAGHAVTARSLLTEPWTAERLLGFFGSTPSNPGSIPLLPDQVRRDRSRSDRCGRGAREHAGRSAPDPAALVEAQGLRCAGFDREPVTSLLDGAADPNAENCSRPEPSPALSGSGPAVRAVPAMNVAAAQAVSPAEIALAYHGRTKHSLKRYAAGPETLDWDAQPNPFREFAGCAQTEFEFGADRLTTSFAQACAPGGTSRLR